MFCRQCPVQLVNIPNVFLVGFSGDVKQAIAICLRCVSALSLNKYAGTDSDSVHASIHSLEASLRVKGFTQVTEYD